MANGRRTVKELDRISQLLPANAGRVNEATALGNVPITGQARAAASALATKRADIDERQRRIRALQNLPSALPKGSEKLAFRRQQQVEQQQQFEAGEAAKGRATAVDVARGQGVEAAEATARGVAGAAILDATSEQALQQIKNEAVRDKIKGDIEIAVGGRTFKSEESRKLFANNLAVVKAEQDGLSERLIAEGKAIGTPEWATAFASGVSASLQKARQEGDIERENIIIGEAVKGVTANPEGNRSGAEILSSLSQLNKVLEEAGGLLPSVTGGGGSDTAEGATADGVNLADQTQTAITARQEQAFDFIRENPEGLRQQQIKDALEKELGFKIKIPKQQGQ